MTSLTRFVLRHRRLVIITWIVLAILGIIASNPLQNRWQQDFSTPGQPAYEANSRMLRAIGSGRQYPIQLVYTSKDGSVQNNQAIKQSIDAVVATGHNARSSSYFNTQADYFLSKDGNTTYANVYPGGTATFAGDPTLPKMQAKLRATTPPGVTAHMTGVFPVQLSETGGKKGSSILVETLIGALGALVILLLIFGTLPAVLMPLMIAFVTILTTFGAVWALTYATDVSIIVQFLIGLVGLGIAIDYSLLVIFRFREELGHGRTASEAVIETMNHAGHSVIVSGSTVAIGLVSLIILPVPFIRAIGIGGMLIPIISVLAAITLLPAVLSLLGERINRWRIPVLWRLANLDNQSAGRGWVAWAKFVTRRPVPVFLVGAVLVGLLVFPAFSINPAESQVRNEPARGDAKAGLAALAAAKIPDGVYGPIEVLIEGKTSNQQVDSLVSKLNNVKGIYGASAPGGWSKGDLRVIEVNQKPDPATGDTSDIIDHLKNDVIPAAQKQIGGGVKLTVAGSPSEDRDFVHAVYGKFPLVLLFVVVLTLILLARALRSIVLPIKAVVLNLLSLGSAYGVITFVFQEGHLSKAIWNFNATDSIVSWIPLMIFAFLYGISMDYEVFMLTRIREEYDAGRDTSGAVAEGLARTGKLVTSAAAILMFTFIVLSTQPGPDFKEFAIGLAAGIAIDATLIRVLLVPAITRLLGPANWWFPEWARKALFLPVAPPRGTLGGSEVTPPAERDLASV